MKTKISQIQARYLIISKKILHSLKFQNCKNKKSIKIVFLVIRRFLLKETSLDNIIMEIIKIFQKHNQLEEYMID
jgi:hypothetical protein